MNGIMEELGVYFDKPMQSVGAENSEYKPETVWNYEIGARYISSGGMIVESDIYYMDCINQQLTVFPAGQSTGRMMTNSGRSRSYGADIEAKWNCKHVAINAAYGWNRAVFTEYNDGNNDYSENRIPYSPEHTLYLCAEYKYRTGCRELKFSSNIRGIGPIWWNEANTLRQPFYMTLGGKISMDWGKFSIYARVENITGSEYRTFYFKSIGNEFFQLSKPAILSIGIVFKS